MRIAMLLGLSVALVGGAAVAGDAKDDTAKLQGKWAVEKDGKKLELTFTKNDFTINFGGKEFKGTFKIDPKKKPKELDMTIKEGDEKFKDKTALCIYEFEGDSLKWCANEPGKTDRPKEFPAKEFDGGPLLYVKFQRVK
jgi:uncharacterized protein (TIGR03067 family)